MKSGYFDNYDLLLFQVLSLYFHGSVKGKIQRRRVYEETVRLQELVEKAGGLISRKELMRMPFAEFIDRLYPNGIKTTLEKIRW